MTAPAGWQKGSFRGVPFVTMDHEATGGRRVAMHEFPQAEKPVLEDLGRRGARYSIECYVRGADHIDKANRLAEALERPGAGTLIHPWLGSMQVGVESYGRRDSVSEGGITSFSIEFVESGLPALPPPASDTAAQATAVADKEKAAAKERFGLAHKIAKVTAFVEQASEKLAKGLAIAAQVQAGLSGGVGGVLGALGVATSALGLPGIARDALALAQSVVNVVQLVGTLTSSLGPLEALLDWGDDLDPVTGSTPARDQERINQAAFVQLVNSVAAAEIVRQIAATSFASYEDAIDVRNRTAARLDRLALRQADAGDDDGAAAYDALRRAMVRDVTARGGSVARLQRYTPATTEPALVIAYRLYGAAALEERVEQVVARNRIAHPAFVPTGVPLQVLTPMGAAEGAANG